MSIGRKKGFYAKAVAGMVFLCIFLSACSQNGKEKGQMLGEKSGETPHITQSLQKNKVYSLGETVSLAFPTNQNPKNIGMQCAVNTAKLYKTTEEAGIDGNQVLTDGDIHYNLKTDVASSFDVSKASFLLCDIMIKNINLNLGDLNITNLSLVCLTSDKDELELVGLPAYFSKSIDVLEGSKYYDFALPVGESMDVKVGWWVDLEECKKENLYVTYNYGGDMEFQQHWKLGL